MEYFVFSLVFLVLLGFGLYALSGTSKDNFKPKEEDSSENNKELIVENKVDVKESKPKQENKQKKVAKKKVTKKKKAMPKKAPPPENNPFRKK